MEKENRPIPVQESANFEVQSSPGYCTISCADQEVLRELALKIAKRLINPKKAELILKNDLEYDIRIDGVINIALESGKLTIDNRNDSSNSLETNEKINLAVNEVLGG